jgi:hypothetical protein
VIFRFAIRSLMTRPMRTAVLAAGFGLGIGVMAALLGVGQVILEQARSPALAGGGDLLIAGGAGLLDNGRYVMAQTIGGSTLGPRVLAASPSRKAALYLVVKPGVTIPVTVRGTIPSLQKELGAPEVADQPNWRDEPGDAAWSSPSPGDLLRAIDRFHPIPQNVPHRSWAEWLYFNGRTPDGRVRFYLTFLVGGYAPGDAASGKRPALVRLQLDRDGKTTNYSALASIDERDLLERAPDLDIAGNRVRLEESRYRLTLALTSEAAASAHRSADLTGEITLDATPDRALPPAAMQGARGWVSGYVVPVLSGAVHGALNIAGQLLPLDSTAGATGYHDHNWGFWEGVRWQWGQVASDDSSADLSIVYGRVFPPASIADADRVPGALAILGPDGPIAFATNVSIEEEGGDTATPRLITVRARGGAIDLTMTFTPADIVRSRMAMTQLTGASPMNFLQLTGTYHVTGRAGGRDVSFTARGSAETFRP